MLSVPLPTSLVNYIIKYLLNASSAPAIGLSSKTGPCFMKVYIRVIFIYEGRN